MSGSANLGLAGAIARAFVGSRLTPLLTVGSVLVGLLALVALPREEEPQIKVPVADIQVAMPGASASEVESRVSTPLERLMWEVPGVEYVYSTSQPGRALIVVRFKVGEDTERSLVKLYQKLQAHPEQLPLGASPPLIKARSIDDVPILALTFHSARVDHAGLRRIAAQVAAEIRHVPQVAETTLIGGYRRQVRLHLDPAALAARMLDVNELLRALGPANRQDTAGALTLDRTTNFAGCTWIAGLVAWYSGASAAIDRTLDGMSLFLPVAVVSLIGGVFALCMERKLDKACLATNFRTICVPREP